MDNVYNCAEQLWYVQDQGQVYCREGMWSIPLGDGQPCVHPDTAPGTWSAVTLSAQSLTYTL